MSVLSRVVEGAGDWVGVVREALDAERATPKQPPRSRDELAFLPAAIEVQETPPRPAGRAILWAVVAALAIAIVWAAVGTVDEVAVANGKLVPSDEVKRVQPLDSGIVAAIHVENGETVRAGAPLITLDPTETDADVSGLGDQLAAIKIEIARLTAANADPTTENFSAPPDLAGHPTEGIQHTLMRAQRAEHLARLAKIDQERAELEAELDDLRAQRAALERTTPILREKVERLGGLSARGNYSEIRLMDDQVALAEREGELEGAAHQASRVQAKLRGLARARDQAVAEFRAARLGELAEAKRREIEFGQELAKAVDRAKRRILRAPVDGRVTDLAVHTIGGVVSPAEDLMGVVPADSRLEAEVRLENKDVGFVRPGDAAAIKVETFTFTRYGVVDAVVESINPNAQTAEAGGDPDAAQASDLFYPTRLTLARTEMAVRGDTVALAPGMRVTAEIKTGKRSFLSFVLTPIVRAIGETGRER